MPEEKFTPADLDWAADELGMLDYFPRDSRAAVMTLLARMCPHRRALKWLVNEAVNHVGKWPGPAELRGMLCTRFDPADGVDHWCSLPGYTAADAEAKQIELHEQRKMQEKIGGYVSEENADFVKRLSGSLPGLPAGRPHGGSDA